MFSTDTVPREFVVAIRWQGPNPNFQLQTKHSGFKTAHEAARFGGANATRSVRPLYFGPQGVWLAGGQNEFLPVPVDRLTGWIRTNHSRSFERKLFHEIAHRTSAFGEYRCCGYVVLGLDGMPTRVALSHEEEDILPVPVKRSIN
jgi:hypothetical protein